MHIKCIYMYMCVCAAGNLHKWCFTMKGCAFLYTKPKKQSTTQSLVISHFAHRAYMDRFFMQGTNEQSRYMTVPAAFTFIEETLGGLTTMRRYNTAVATEAANRLVHMWKTRLLVPHHLCAPFLRVILTPLDFRPFLSIFISKETLMAAGFPPSTHPTDLESHVAMKLAATDPTLNESIAQAIFTDTGIQGQFFYWVVNGQGRIYCRISAQVYNTLDDYKALGKAVLRLCAATTTSKV